MTQVNLGTIVHKKIKCCQLTPIRLRSPTSRLQGTTPPSTVHTNQPTRSSYTTRCCVEVTLKTNTLAAQSQLVIWSNLALFALQAFSAQWSVPFRPIRAQPSCHQMLPFAEIKAKIKAEIKANYIGYQISKCLNIGQSYCLEI